MSNAASCYLWSILCSFSSVYNQSFFPHLSLNFCPIYELGEAEVLECSFMGLWHPQCWLQKGTHGLVSDGWGKVFLLFFLLSSLFQRAQQLSFPDGQECYSSCLWKSSWVCPGISVPALQLNLPLIILLSHRGREGLCCFVVTPMGDCLVWLIVTL